jgi:hypothetical protein
MVLGCSSASSYSHIKGKSPIDPSFWFCLARSLCDRGGNADGLSQFVGRVESQTSFSGHEAENHSVIDAGRLPNFVNGSAR